MPRHYKQQMLDAVLEKIVAANGEIVPYKELEPVMEKNSNIAYAVRADVQRAVTELIQNGAPVIMVNREGYRFAAKGMSAASQPTDPGEAP